MFKIKSLMVISYVILFCFLGIFIDFIAESATNRTLEDASLIFLSLIWFPVIIALHLVITLLFQVLTRIITKQESKIINLSDLSTVCFSLFIILIGSYIVYEEVTEFFYLMSIIFGLSILLNLGFKHMKNRAIEINKPNL